MAVPTKEELRAALASRHGEEIQQKFEKVSVAVCGAGGLGSNVSICLARAGVGRIKIIDFDTIEPSNLNRQQYTADQVGLPKAEAMAQNLHKINPYCQVEAHVMKITPDNIPGLFDDVDIVMECFDNPVQKAILVNGVLENYPGKNLIAASGMAGMNSGNDIKTRKVSKHFYLCGDTVSDVGAGLGLYSARVMICAAHEALKALQLIAGVED